MKKQYRCIFNVRYRKAPYDWIEPVRKTSEFEYELPLPENWWDEQKPAIKKKYEVEGRIVDIELLGFYELISTLLVDCKLLDTKDNDL